MYKDANLKPSQGASLQMLDWFVVLGSAVEFPPVVHISNSYGRKNTVNAGSISYYFLWFLYAILPNTDGTINKWVLPTLEWKLTLGMAILFYNKSKKNVFFSICSRPDLKFYVRHSIHQKNTVSLEKKFGPMLTIIRSVSSIHLASPLPTLFSFYFWVFLIMF